MTASPHQKRGRHGGAPDGRRDALLAAVDVGIWYCDLPFDELIWDQKVKEHFWLPPNARVTIETFYARLHPDDRERTRQAIERAISTRTPYDIEYRTLAPDGHPEAGQIRWVRAIGYTAYGADGQPTRFDGLTVDISAARNSAAALEEAQAALRLATHEDAELAATLQRIGSTLTSEVELERIVQTVTDESTHLTGAQFGAFFYNVVNERGEAMTLYTLTGVPREAFSRFPMPRNTAVFSPTFHGEGVVRSGDITKDARYGKNPPYNGMPKGHLPVVSYLAVPVRSRSGDVIGGLFFGHERANVFTNRHEQLVVGIAGWAAVAMDNARLFEAQRQAVEQARESEMAAQRARREAEEANRAKSDFLAKMSHDLRTPLNAIGGYSQLLAMGIQGKVSDEQRVSLERIGRAQHHLLTLINDILSFAKLEAGQVAIARDAVPVRSTLEELNVLLAPQARASGVELRLDPGPGDVLVRADRARLMQILINLGSNAFKFTEKGWVAVRAKASADVIRFEVEDTGCGISADRQAMIFEPFVQARSVPGDDQAGAGLGLAISRELARLMGGTLSVVSEVARGSQFTLELPRS